jgi:hypothetical protein
MNAPKVGTCYCGCGAATGGWWAPGHDQRAAVWLAKLELAPANRAAMLLALGYGPNGRNLQDEARAAGIDPGPPPAQPAG